MIYIYVNCTNSKVLTIITATPPEFLKGGLKTCQPSPPPLILRGCFFNCSHMLLCIGYFYRRVGSR